MFRFENSKRLTIQCVVYVCEETDCSELSSQSPDSCPTIPAPLIGSPNARFQFQRDTNDSVASGSGTVLTSLTVNVLDVGEASGKGGDEDGNKDLLVFEPEQCVGGVCPRWLLWLVITLGVLFLLMLLVNLFLCSGELGFWGGLICLGVVLWLIFCFVFCSVDLYVYEDRVD